MIVVDLLGAVGNKVALKLTEAYPKWKAGIKVEIGERYKKGDMLYKVI